MAKLQSFEAKRSPKVNAMLSFGVLFLGVFLFGALPTQWFAVQYGYHANLGAPAFRLWSIAVYWPLDWVVWGWRFGDIEILKHNVNILTMLGIASVALAIIVTAFFASMIANYSNGMDGLHGTAHWAEWDDVNNTGFVSHKRYESRGVIVGSVICDRKGQLIHPHHLHYARRYTPLMVRRDGWRGLVGMKDQKRDSNGQPMYKLNKWVVKRVELLRDGKNTHIFAFCPTRSGKGRGMIVPTLLTWPNSVMVNDPKGEAYALTAGFRRSAGQETIKFEPACIDGTGARWNPLDEIRIFTLHDVKDAQMIMSIACDPSGQGLEDYFDKAGYEFLTGLALHVKYAEANGSLEGIAKFLGDPNWDNDKQMYNHMLSSIHDPDGKMGWRDPLGNPTKTHPMVANAAKTMLNKEDKDRSGVLSTAKSLLSLYLDPIVAQNTNCSDFLVRDLMTHSKPVSLYYVVSPADMVRLIPLTRLFYDLFVRRNAADMEFEDGRSKKSWTFDLLMILDEMTSLRKLPVIQEALGYVAGYGIRMFMLVQDIAQVEDLYGDKQTVESGAETRIVYAPNKTATARMISDMAGKTTVKETKSSKSIDTFGFKPGNVSLNEEKHSRDLITQEEVSMLHDQDVLIFVKGQPPIYGRKAYYDENPVLLGRAKIPAPKRSSVLRQPPPVGEIAIKPARGDSGEVSNSSREETVSNMADKWAASREAMRQRIVNSLDDVGELSFTVEPLPNNAGGGESVVVTPASSASAAKPKSRYTKKQDLTEEERKELDALLGDIALTEHVATISAFSVEPVWAVTE